MDLVYEALEQLWNIMAFGTNGTTSRLVEFLEFCAGMKTSKLLAANELSASEHLTEPQLEESATILLESTVMPSTHVLTVDKSSSMSVIPPLASEMRTERGNTTPFVFVQNNTYISDEISSDMMLSPVGLLAKNEDSTVATDNTVQTLKQKQHPWLTITGFNQCNDAYLEFRKYVDDVIVVPYEHIQQVQEFFTLAEEFAQAVDDNTNKYDHNECLALVQEGRDVIDLFGTIFNLARKVKLSDLEESMAIIVEILRRLEEFKVPESDADYDTRLKEACWKNFYLELYIKYEVSKLTIGRTPEIIKNPHTAIEQWYQTPNDIAFDITFLSDIMTQYLIQNITKQELAEEFFSEQNVKKRENMFQGVKEMDNLMQEYERSLYIVSDYLWQSYYTLINEKPFSINGSSVQRLQLVQKAATVDKFTDWAKNGNVDAIIKNIPKVIEDGPVKQLNNNITQPLLAMERQLKIVEASLREYQESIKVDSQFYL